MIPYSFSSALRLSFIHLHFTLYLWSLLQSHFVSNQRHVFVLTLPQIAYLWLHFHSISHYDLTHFQIFLFCILKPNSLPVRLFKAKGLHTNSIAIRTDAITHLLSRCALKTKLIHACAIQSSPVASVQCLSTEKKASANFFFCSFYSCYIFVLLFKFL